MKKNKYYGYFLPGSNHQGVCENWEECRKIVEGKKGARFRGFNSKKEAGEWLSDGAFYHQRQKAKLEPGIYFDSGTGRGIGVEINVTNEKEEYLLKTAISVKKLNRFQHLVLKNVTNNYGELLACKYALKIALKKSIKKVFGDSKLIIDFWSKGIIRRKEVAKKTYLLSLEVKKLRIEFENRGGELLRISGADNPADLGFHN